MSIKDELTNEIKKKKRPNISDSSVRTYVSLLTNLNKKINDGKDDILSFCKKHNVSDIVEYISEKYESNQSKRQFYLLYLF